MPDAATTVVSAKGQIVLPKSVREHKAWPSGTRLIVEETPEGVLLKPAPAFAPSRIGDVFETLAYAGPAKTVEEMDAAVAAEARRRHGRD